MYRLQVEFARDLEVSDGRITGIFRADSGHFVLFFSLLVLFSGAERACARVWLDNTK